MIIANQSKEILKPGGKCCGNCKYHSAYHYPNTIFCFDKFTNKENPVRSIFNACNEWEFKEQACFCLDDALKHHSNAENFVSQSRDEIRAQICDERKSSEQVKK